MAFVHKIREKNPQEICGETDERNLQKYDFMKYERIYDNTSKILRVGELDQLEIRQ